MLDFNPARRTFPSKNSFTTISFSPGVSFISIYSAKTQGKKKENIVILLSLVSTSPSAPTASTAPTTPVSSITSVATATATRVAGVLLLLDDVDDFFGDP